MGTRAFEKIIGYETIKMELMQINDVLANMDVYQRLGVSTLHRLLLHGDPGVGKSLMASAARCLNRNKHRQKNIYNRCVAVALFTPH